MAVTLAEGRQQGFQWNKKPKQRLRTVYVTEKNEGQKISLSNITRDKSEERGKKKKKKRLV